MEKITIATTQINIGGNVYHVTANLECYNQLKKLGLVSLNALKCQNRPNFCELLVWEKTPKFSSYMKLCSLHLVAIEVRNLQSQSMESEHMESPRSRQGPGLWPVPLPASISLSIEMTIGSAKISSRFFHFVILSSSFEITPQSFANSRKWACGWNLKCLRS